MLTKNIPETIDSPVEDEEEMELDLQFPNHFKRFAFHLPFKKWGII